MFTFIIWFVGGDDIKGSFKDELIAKASFQKFCEFAAKRVDTDSPPSRAYLYDTRGLLLDSFDWR
jgi:hypothetical protein